MNQELAAIRHALTTLLPPPPPTTPTTTPHTEIVNYLIIVDQRQPNGDRHLRTIGGDHNDETLPFWTHEMLLDHAPRLKPVN